MIEVEVVNNIIKDNLILFNTKVMKNNEINFGKK
jgi:hypothetical protein